MEQHMADPMMCPLCLNAFNTTGNCPRVLSCGHTICENCLGSIAQTCPIDQMDLVWPTKAPKNEVLLSIIIQSSVTSSAANVSAANVINKVPANATYGKCPTHLLDFCLYDSDCNIFMCVGCITSEAHLGHKYNTIDFIVKKVEVLMKKSIPDWISRVENLKKVEAHAQTQHLLTDTNLESSTKIIKDVFTSLRMKVDMLLAKEEEILFSLNVAHKAQLFEVAAKVDQIQESVALLNQAVEVATTYNSNDLNSLNAYMQMNSRIQTAMSVPITLTCLTQTVVDICIPPDAFNVFDMISGGIQSDYSLKKYLSVIEAEFHMPLDDGESVRLYLAAMSQPIEFIKLLTRPCHSARLRSIASNIIDLHTHTSDLFEAASMNLKCVSAIFDVLRFPFPDNNSVIREEGFATLALIVTKYVVKPVVFKPAYINVMISAICDPTSTADTHLSACKIIHTLLWDQQVVTTSIHKIGKVMEMHHNKANVLAAYIRVCCEMCKEHNGDFSVEKLVDQNWGVGALIRAMVNHTASVDVQVAACELIFLLAMSEDIERRLVEAGCIHAVVQAMVTHVDCESIQYYGSAALRNLAYLEGHPSKIALAGGTRELIEAYRRFPLSERIHKEVFYALSDILTQDPESTQLEFATIHEIITRGIALYQCKDANTRRIIQSMFNV